VLNSNGKISLDELARAPALADDLAPGTVASLLGQAHIAIAALEARLLVASVERKEPPTADHEPARLMTAGEVAQRLGFKPGYVYELARAGKIKSLRQGKYTRFSEAALSEYIAGNGSAVEVKLSTVLSIVREPRTVQRRSARHRPHANGNGAAPGRASDDG